MARAERCECASADRDAMRPTIAEFAEAIKPGATTLEEIVAACPGLTLADVEELYRQTCAIRARQDALHQSRD